MNITLNNSYNKKNRVLNFFFRDVYDGRFLATLRIGTGLILLSQFIQLLPDVQALMGENGMVRPDLQAVDVPAYILSLPRLATYANAYMHIRYESVIYLLGIVYAIVIVLLTFGLLTRINACLAWLLHLSFIYSAHLFTYGVDYFLTALLFYNVVFPVGRVYSIDKLLFKYKASNYTPYIRLLQIHICLVYFISGLAKAVGTNWWNGMSIWKAINRPSVTSYNIHFLSSFEDIYVVAGIATIIVELFYCFFIWNKHTRILWLTLTCLMHLTIAFVLQLPYFAAVMILFNIVTFSYKPKEQNNKNTSYEEQGLLNNI
ncbi:MAG: hypothetical protein BGO69_04810 [Bacteroidetes bacterium 46-16]|nr:MAG: hypothetical protein BGO69_04810 [Bacteroidetes bacterium 46-16]